MRKWASRVLALGLLSIPVCSGVANAATTYDFTSPFKVTFSGGSYSADATFTIGSNTIGFPTGCTPSVCSSKVIDITGTLTTGLGTFDMTLLPENTILSNDNSGSVFVSSVTPRFSPSGFGVGFEAGGIDYNLDTFVSMLLAVSAGFELCTTTSCTTLTSYSATFAPPSAVPLPGALPLFATGLGALGVLGMRRRRKRAAAAG